MSRNPSALRFDPSGRFPGQPSDGRRRVLVLGAGAVLVALAGASVANSQHASLRCIEGRLVPHVGRLLPLGDMPLDDAELRPLEVPPGECEDESFESRSELRERYRELALGRADAALADEDPSALETSLEALEALPDDEVLGPRTRQLNQVLLERHVEQARESYEEARRRLQLAREAGVDEEVLRAAEQTLDGLSAPASAVPPAPPSPEASEAPQAVRIPDPPAPAPGPGPRSL